MIFNNHYSDKCPILAHIHRRPSSRCLMSLGGFDPPPLTLRLSVRSHYATMTCLIYAPTFAHICHIHFFDVSIFLIYHRVVSINRPSGYEPDALPLRHDDGVVIWRFRSTSSKAGWRSCHRAPMTSVIGWFRSTSSNAVRHASITLK